MYFDEGSNEVVSNKSSSTRVRSTRTRRWRCTLKGEERQENTDVRVWRIGRTAK